MQQTSIGNDIAAERESLLRRLETGLEPAMAALGLLWLVLLVLEFTRGVSPLLSRISTAVWVAFLFDFALKFSLAPHKLRFLKRNVLTLVSLAIPALRVARLARLTRVLRATRGLRLLRLLTSINRGMRSLGGTLRRRGFGYVLLLTLIVLFAGAAGMYTLESDTSPAFADYGSALWWTAMVLVTMGSDAWPKTAEGRLLCLALAVYGYSVFGYITAAVASVFIAADRARDAAGPGRSRPSA